MLEANQNNLKNKYDTEHKIKKIEINTFLCIPPLKSKQVNMIQNNELFHYFDIWICFQHMQTC